jgi:hypothetical protein
MAAFREYLDSQIGAGYGAQFTTNTTGFIIYHRKAKSLRVDVIRQFDDLLRTCADTQFTSLTFIVRYFYQRHIQPRLSPAENGQA